jgi:outer membrane protein assembly factor BamB
MIPTRTMTRPVVFTFILAVSAFLVRPATARQDEPFGSTQSFNVDAARGICFDGVNVWITQDGPNTVTALRASDGVLFGVFPAGGGGLDAVFDGTYVWACNLYAGTVTRLLASDGSMHGTFPAGAAPFSVIFDGANIWVTNFISNTVTKLRATDGQLLGTFPVGVDPRGLAFDGASIWVTNYDDGTVTKLRASDGTLENAFRVHDYPESIVYDGVGGLWIGHGDGTLLKLRASDGSPLGARFIGVGPTDLDINGRDLWTTAESGETVERLGWNRGQLRHVYPVTGQPFAIVIAGDSVWVTEYLAGRVLRIGTNQ